MMIICKTNLKYKIIEILHYLSVKLNRAKGVSTIKRNPELIVSLTTIPERIDMLALCLDSLLRQSLKPDRLILWLSETHETNYKVINRSLLPTDLLRLIPRGLEIRWCKDIRSFRKIVPTRQEHPKALIVTADDDIFYPRYWLKALYEAYQAEPQYVHCHRAHRIKYDVTGTPLSYNQWQMMAEGYQGPSFALFPTSGGGALYAPNHLHAEMLNERAFLSLCPKADDVWLKAMSLMANVQCKKVAKETFPLIELRIPNNRTLWSENSTVSGNDPQIKAVAERYGVFMERKHA
ncbi:MAG: hypothetical protein CFE38_08175 [Comamonadaceae bacterium PBBC1]|nr:MAG: hypothetical protein CFE38_08175 [Comamonadaceae bacterium PBBC1]